VEYYFSCLELNIFSKPGLSFIAFASLFLSVNRKLIFFYKYSLNAELSFLTTTLKGKLYRCYKTSIIEMKLDTHTHTQILII
jgi:hypothetical protein